MNIRKNLTAYSLILLHTTGLCASSWQRSTGDNESSRYSELSQINTSNVIQLEKSWEFRSGFIPKNRDTVQLSPIFTGQKIITADLSGKVYALNPGSGAKIWESKLPAPAARRGMTYESGHIYVPTSKGVYQISEESGKVERVYGDELSLLPPIVRDDYLYTANLGTGVEKYQISNGKRLWHQNLRTNCGVARIWSGFSYDTKTEAIYITTGNSNALRSDQPTNCLANSLISISAASGEINWRFQEFKHDKWDLDMVSNPLIFDLTIKKEKVRTVATMSKTGAIYLINAASGRSIKTPKDEANHRIEISKAIESMRADDIAINMRNILKTEGPRDNIEYIKSRIKKYSGRNLTDSKIDDPAFVFGIHGGFEWPGGTLYRPRKLLIAPSNFYPWVIRTELQANNPEKVSSSIKRNSILAEYCIDCHSKTLEGKKTNELNRVGAGFYVPSLLHKIFQGSERHSSQEEFNEIHKDALFEMTPFIKETPPTDEDYLSDESFAAKILRKTNSLLASKALNKILIDVHSYLIGLERPKKAHLTKVLAAIDQNIINGAEQELSSLGGLFTQTDFTYNSFWQMLVDKENNPITKGPWGKLTAFDLDKNQIAWQIPFGYEGESKTSRRVEGSRNFGGVLSTNGGLLFATGTVDLLARAYDLSTGRELWSSKLPYSGSSPPMTYLFEGCQYILFTATGGRFSYFGDLGDSTVAFRKSACN